MVWNYFNEAANLNLDGNLGNLEDRYFVQLAFPITTPWEMVALVFLIIVPLGLLVLKKAINELEKLFPFDDLDDSEV
jgi:hypothetical protein